MADGWGWWHCAAFEMVALPAAAAAADGETG